MHRIWVDPRAAAEAEAATVWYERKRPGLGREFLLDLQSVFEGIRSGVLPTVPVTGVPLGRGIRRVFLKRFPYAVVLVTLQDAQVVIAIAHFARRPGYWRTCIDD